MPKIPDSILKKMIERPKFTQEEWTSRAFLGSKGLGLSTANIGKLVKAYQKATKKNNATAWDVTLDLIELVNNSNSRETIELVLLDPSDNQVEAINDLVEHFVPEDRKFKVFVDVTTDSTYTPLKINEELCRLLPDTFECCGKLGLPWDKRGLHLFKTSFHGWVKKFTSARSALISMRITEILDA